MDCALRDSSPPRPHKHGATPPRAAPRKGENRSEDGRQFRILGKTSNLRQPAVDGQFTPNRYWRALFFPRSLLSVSARAHLAARANLLPNNLMRGLNCGNSFGQYFVGLKAMLSGYGSRTVATSLRSPRPRASRWQRRENSDVAALVFVADPVAAQRPIFHQRFHRPLAL